MPDRSRSEKSITEKDFNDILGYSDKIKEEFKSEEVVYWRYTHANETNYYFELKNRIKAVLLYYIMQIYGERCKFKMPKDYEKFQQTDVMQRFTALFKVKT
jgi:hypothetical protein